MKAQKRAEKWEDQKESKKVDPMVEMKVFQKDNEKEYSMVEKKVALKE